MKCLSSEMTPDFLDLVPPISRIKLNTITKSWPNAHRAAPIDTLEDLSEQIKKHLPVFPQLYKTFDYQYDLENKLLSSTDGQGLKLLGRMLNFLLGEKERIHLKNYFSVNLSNPLDEQGMLRVIDFWLNELCVKPRTIMGLDSHLELIRDSLKVSLDFIPNDNSKIYFEFDVIVQIKHPLTLPEEKESFFKSFSLQRSQKNSKFKLNRELWKLWVYLAKFGSKIRFDEQYRAIYTQDANAFGELIEHIFYSTATKNYYSYPFEKKINFNHLIPLAITSHVEKDFDFFWKKYGKQDVYSMDFINQRMEYSWRDFIASFSINYGEQNFEQAILYLENLPKTNEKIRLLCDLHKKMLTKLYGNSPEEKITFRITAKKLARELRKQVQLDPLIFVDSKMEPLAKYAKLLML